MKYKKPIIIFPRRYDLGEHRNDHQYDTCKKLINQPFIKVAWSESDLISIVSNFDHDQFSYDYDASPLNKLRVFLADYVNSIISSERNV